MFCCFISSLVNNIPATGGENTKTKKEGEDGETPAVPALSDTDLDVVLSCLEEIAKVFAIAPSLIAQPGRTLPGKQMFENKVPATDPYPNLYHLANSGYVASCVVILQ